MSLKRDLKVANAFIGIRRGSCGEHLIRAVSTMEEESERRKAIALFIAFGTKGDVYPLAVILRISIRILGSLRKRNQRRVFFCLQAIAAAFARVQQHYSVVLMSHLAHEVGFLLLLLLKFSTFGNYVLESKI